MKSGAGSEADRRVGPIAAIAVLASLMLLGGCASDFAIEDAFGFDGARCDRIVEAVQQRLDADSSG